MARKKEDTRRPQQIIIDMCRLLESLGVTRIVCDYSASDYEGDMNSIYCEFGARDEIGATHFPYNARNNTYTDPHITAAISARALRDVLRELSYAAPNQPAVISETEVEKFNKALYGILPSGWDQEEAGSHGEIVINAITGKIEIRHNRRVVHTNSQTITYTNGVETPTITDVQA